MLSGPYRKDNIKYNPILFKEIGNAIAKWRPFCWGLNVLNRRGLGDAYTVHISQLGNTYSRHQAII